MKQDGRTLYAEGKKVLYIEKLNKYTRQYTCGTVMLPIAGVLQEVTVTPEDVEEDLRDSGFIEEDMTDDEVADMIDYHYREEIESWIRYYALPATGPNDQDEE